MQTMRNNTKTAAVIATVLLLMASVTLMTIQAKTVHAQLVGGVHSTPRTYTDWTYPQVGPLPDGVTPHATIDTIAFLSFTPNPIGVGQTLLVNVWTTPGTTVYLLMQGYTVTIQKPDGTTEVIGPFNSYLGDCTAWFQYVVDQVGTWKLKFEHPGTYIPPGTYFTRPQQDTILPDGTTLKAGDPKPILNITIGASIYYEPSSTDWQELTVQQDFVYSWPSVPLPTDYWTRPVSAENREWWSILGYYPWTGAYYYPNGRVLYSSNYKYTPYVQAPNTAHIVWKQQGAIAGLIGGEQYQFAMMSSAGMPSSSAGTPSIIYAGRCYQTLTKAVDNKPTSVWECYDLRTGEVYWDLTGITAPTNILYEGYTGTGAIGAEATSGITVYLVAMSGGRLLKYWPYTGEVLFNISLPITSGTIYNNEWVLSVQTINATAGNYRLINWSMAGTTTNFTKRIGSNITWPRSTVGTVDYDAGIAAFGGSCFAQPEGYKSFLDRGASTFSIGVNLTTVDMKTGATLYDISLNDTSLGAPLGSSTFVCDRGKVAASFGRNWVCWDGRTGKILWKSELSDYPWGTFWAYNVASYDFNESKGAIIGCSYDGVYAFDWDDGKILWQYSSPMVPFESPYGTESFFSAAMIADGKVYAYTGEHSPSYPITRGWHMHCINATTGEGIWKITGIMSPAAVADGYLMASNAYDGYMYVFGKGKSQTTVTAPDVVVLMGTGVVIKGTVLDQSPAQLGTPCVSKGSMQTQMEYLHMQHPIDGLYHNETLSGVPVILTAIGSDGTVTDIGSVTTNGYYGTFTYGWTPPKEGTYTIMASFAGDDSYGSSSAATGLVVGPAPASPTPTPTPQPQAAPDSIPYIIGIGIAIIIAVAIATILILRKRA